MSENAPGTQGQNRMEHPQILSEKMIGQALSKDQSPAKGK